MQNTSSITVIIPCRNEEQYIGQVLDSILLQNYDQKKIEVLVIDGSSDDKTREIVAGYSKNATNISVLDNPMRTVPYALNLGIRKAKGEVIVRMDAHSKYPNNYLSRLSSQLEVLGADNVGGKWNTLPAENTPICKAIAIASSHNFGIGNSLHKTGTSEITQTDTVPFGCFRRELFDKIGMFDIDLIRNQDDEFNARIIKNGGKIYLIPDVIIDYFARKDIRKMSKMFYQYGLFKPLVNKKLGAPATLRQFFPPLFVAGLILGLILCFVGRMFIFVYASVLASYMVLSLYFSLVEVMKYRNSKLVLLLPYLFFVIHTSYGWGYLMGIFRFLIFRNTKLNLTISR
jgi:glycosyltransferase involved in cell wall biosynthesis